MALRSEGSLSLLNPSKALRLVALIVAPAASSRCGAQPTILHKLLNLREILPVTLKADQLLLKNSALGCCRRFGELLREPEVQGRREVGDRSGGHDRRRRNELRQFPEVLGGGGEEELVVGAAWSSQPEAVEAQDALQMGKQHLDLLPLPP